MHLFADDGVAEVVVWWTVRSRSGRWGGRRELWKPRFESVVRGLHH